MKAVLSILLCLVYLQTTAQQFHVSLTEIFESESPFTTLAVPDGGYIGVRETPENVSGMNWNKYRMTVSVVLYDENMKVIKEKQLSEGKNVYSAFYSSFKKIGNTYWFIYVEPAVKNNIGNIMAVSIDPATLETGQPRILAASSSIGLSLPLVSGITEKDIRFILSPDRKQAMLFVSAGKEQFYISRLDEQLNVVWGRKETIAELKKRTVASTVIDNAGNVYLSYMNQDKRDEMITGHIMVYKQTGPPLHIPVSLVNAWAREVQLLASKKGDSIHVAGSYWEETDNVAGVYKGTIAISDKKLKDIRKTDISPELVEQLANDGFASAKNKKYGLEPAFISKLVESDDGVVTLAGEFRYHIIKGNASYVISGSIFLASFSDTKAVFARIPKARRSAGSTIADSYAIIPFNDYVIVFYNDVEKNLNQDISLEPARSDVYLHAMLVAAKVGRDGSVKREKLIDLREEDFLAVGESMIKISPSELLFKVYKIRKLGGTRKEMRMAAVSID